MKTEAVFGLKQKLTAIKKTHFTEDEAKPLVHQLVSALEKIHKLGIVHRDLNPSNIFIHFPSFPTQESPTARPPSLSGPPNSTNEDDPQGVHNPMDHVMNAQLKIIDFNHSRMFRLNDSPFSIRKRRRALGTTNQTEEEFWTEMSELPSPQIWQKSPLKDPSKDNHDDSST